MERLILFDIDGTLTRTQNGYIPFNEAIRKTFGVAADIRSVIPDGNTDPLIVEEIFAKADHRIMISAEQWRQFNRQLRECYLDAFRGGAARVTALPGALELLKALAEAEGMGGSIVTGNFESVAHVKLETAGLQTYLHRGAYASDSRHRIDLPAIAKERWERASGRSVRADQCIIVGDTPKDLEAARKNGMKCVLVGTGRYPLEELEYYKPDGCVRDLTDADSLSRMLREI